MSDLVQLERPGDGVGVVTLRRPDRLNAIGTATLVELGLRLDEIEADETVGAVVVTGEGKAFSAGADIGELNRLDHTAAFAHFIQRFTDTYSRLQRLPKPSIAAVRGVAYGGGFELALACDLRVAGEGARFGVPEIKLGLLPGAGGTARLTKMLPPAVAKQLLMTGDPLPAADAHRLGLVNTVVPDGQVLEAACTLAARRAPGPGVGAGGRQAFGGHGPGHVARRRGRARARNRGDALRQRGSRGGNGGVPGQAPPIVLRTLSVRRSIGSCSIGHGGPSPVRPAR